jgi:competence protein ComEC
MKQKYTYFAFAVLMVFLLFLILVIRKNDRRLEVIFLDVGQGDSILIKTAFGKRVLVDGGKYEFLEAKISKYFPWYQRKIDLVIATHPDLDHVGGLVGIMRRYDISNFLHSGLLAGAEAYQQIAELVQKRNIPVVDAKLGNTIYLDPLTRLEILYPEDNLQSFDANEYSVVTRLVYQDTSVLLTGDANMFTEQDLVEFFGDDVKSDILKLGHHGSATSSSQSFLSVVSPEYAIVSAGCDNSYGHPDPKVIERVQETNAHILDTCTKGNIVFHSDGKKWELK